MFKFKAAALVVVALPLVTTDIHAQTTTSVQYEQCMDSVDLSGMKNSQWAACAEQEIQRQDVVLNAEYKKLRKLLPAEQIEALTKGQASWLKFREDWCRFKETTNEAPGGVNNYYDCFIDLTNQQIDELKGEQELAEG